MNTDVNLPALMRREAEKLRNLVVCARCDVSNHQPCLTLNFSRHSDCSSFEIFLCVFFLVVVVGFFP